MGVANQRFAIPDSIQVLGAVRESIGRLAHVMIILVPGLIRDLPESVILDLIQNLAVSHDPVGLPAHTRGPLVIYRDSA